MGKDVALSVKDWLAQDPPEADIESIAGVNVIRQKVIERLLDELTGCNWETDEFKLVRFFDDAGIGWVDASLVLVVNYRDGDEKITRRLVGCVTYDIPRFGMLHSANTAKSLCIVNASSELGVKFGRNLNPSVEPVIEGKKIKPSNGKAPVKFPATEEIIRQYKNARVQENKKMEKSITDIYEIPDDIVNRIYATT